MRLLIIGGSGRTGKLIIEAALQAGHTVTALVRNPGSLTPAPGLSITQGTPEKTSDISLAITSTQIKPDAVIVSLASLRKSDSPFSANVSSPTFMTDVHTLLLAEMEKHGIERLITMSAFGVGDSNPSVWWPMRMVLNKSPMAIGFADHKCVEDIVRKAGKEGGIRWTLVRPCMLAGGVDGGEALPVRVLNEQGDGAGCMPSVTRRSVAAWIIGTALDEVKGAEWIGKTPVLAN